MDGSAASFRVDWGISCLCFYMGTSFLLFMTVLMALRIGPFQPRYEVYVKEAASVKSSTVPSFQIFVHPAKEDMYVSVEIQVCHVSFLEYQCVILRPCAPGESPMKPREPLHANICSCTITSCSCFARADRHIVPEDGNVGGAAARKNVSSHELVPGCCTSRRWRQYRIPLPCCRCEGPQGSLVCSMPALV